MFLAKSLNEKLKKSLSEYNVEDLPEPKFKYDKKHPSGFLLFNSREGIVDFDKKHKKFNDDIIPFNAKEAKKYVKELIDPDILEIRQKRWNISAKADLQEKPELKKTLFDVSHGLKDFQVVPLNTKHVEVGIDSRNTREIDGKNWNLSTLLEQIEKKEISKKK